MTDTPTYIPLKFWFNKPQIEYTKEGQYRIDKIKNHGQEYMELVTLFFASYKLNDEIPDTMIEPLTYCLPDPHTQIFTSPMLILGVHYYDDAYSALTSFFPFDRTSSNNFYSKFLEQKYNLECKNNLIMLKARYHIDELPSDFDLTDLINANNVCGCVEGSVVSCVNNWIINNKPTIVNHKGITNIFEYVANKRDNNTLNDAGKEVITTIILAMFLMNCDNKYDLLDIVNTGNARGKITCVPTFIMQYYDLNYDHMSVVLHALDEFVDHGCSLRCPWLSSASKDFLHNQNHDYIVQLYCKLIQWINEIN